MYKFCLLLIVSLSWTQEDFFKIWNKYKSPSPALPQEQKPSIMDKLKELIRANGSQTDIHKAAKTVKDYLTEVD